MSALDGAHPDHVNPNKITSIDKFKAIVSEKGFHDASRYVVSITSPIGAMSTENALYCKGLNVKGAAFQTTNRFSHGPERDIPYLETYGDGTSLTFYNDYEFTEYNYFLTWMQTIGGQDWYIKWYKDFIGNVYIASMDEQNIARLGISLAEVYPKSISDISLSYDARGKEISTFTVNLAFHHYEIHSYSGAQADKVGTFNEIQGDAWNKDDPMMEVSGDLIKLSRFNDETGNWDFHIVRGPEAARALTAQEIKDIQAGQIQDKNMIRRLWHWASGR